MNCKTNTQYTAIVVIAAFFWQSCLKKEEYPVVPAITFGAFQIFQNQLGNDSAAVFSINYTDGDGDIGLSQADTIAPYTGQFYYNCYIEYYEKQNGIWLQPPVNPPFYFRIPVLNNGTRPVTGSIDINLNAPFYAPTPYDTIKYIIKIADRSLHLSNVIETPAIVVDK